MYKDERTARSEAARASPVTRTRRGRAPLLPESVGSLALGGSRAPRHLTPPVTSSGIDVPPPSTRMKGTWERAPGAVRAAADFRVLRQIRYSGQWPLPSVAPAGRALVIYRRLLRHQFGDPISAGHPGARRWSVPPCLKTPVWSREGRSSSSCATLTSDRPRPGIDGLPTLSRRKRCLSHK